MRNKMMVGLPLLAAGMIALGGCTAGQSDAGEALAGKEPSHSDKRHQTVKVGAALTFTHIMPTGRLQPGGNYSAALTIKHGYSGGTLSLSANADEGIILGVRQSAVQLTKSGAVNWNIPFKTNANGVYYINIIGTVTKADGSTEARAYSIPVEVGDQSGQKKPALKEVILPAEEEIIR
ncbi:MAG: hypothetical protein HC843_13870 [Sphingomonadales bacterium]|nr:hypothetical protein [Sphingomonadales bacterium]